jgi:gliding motility-associated-like protein
MGDSILLQGSGAMTYEWNTFPIQYTSSIRVSPQANTNYTLIGYTSQNCPGEASHYVIVSEKLTLTLLNDQRSMLVTAYPEGLEAYTFEIGGELIQSGPKNYWSYSEYAGPSDTLLVTGFPKNGCGDEAFTYVDVEEAPNAFTPNGDGKNDLFLPGVEIRVFSSWGGELFHGNEGWDGRYQGKLVVPGTYYYVRPVYDGDGTLIKTIKGSVTVVIE